MNASELWNTKITEYNDADKKLYSELSDMIDEKIKNIKFNEEDIKTKTISFKLEYKPLDIDINDVLKQICEDKCTESHYIFVSDKRAAYFASEGRCSCCKNPSTKVHGEQSSINKNKCRGHGFTYTLSLGEGRCPVINEK